MPNRGAPHRANCGVSLIPVPPGRDYARAPFLVIWEVTQACDLACVHCRASALPRRDPAELSSREASDLFRQARRMGTRLLVLTGGDPLKRSDIFDLIATARRAGLHVSLSPSVTPLLTAAALARGRQAGLSAVSLSLDGADADAHDTFRGVEGSFDRTRRAAREVRDAGLQLRINTTVTASNLADLASIARIVAACGARNWSVFFLVPTGRANGTMQITAAQCEQVLHWLYEISRTAPFRIKTTEAPHYRRVVLEALAREAGVGVDRIVATTRSGGGRFVPGLNDARGLVFISHRGDVCPSGFFPLPAGNLREAGLALLYRDSALFRGLRDPALLKGRCGRCPYRTVCGGSRARAYAATGDPLEEDPLCAHHPEASAA